ncbi:MAG: PLDc N-terminal domain-containing protein [Solirubrobacterales bacterium]
MLLLADISLGDLLVAMIAFFFLFLAIWMFIAVFADIFSRDDLSGWGKAGWVLLIFVIPLIGVLIYLIARPEEVGQGRPFSRE